jgi:hypothetical protein
MDTKKPTPTGRSAGETGMALITVILVTLLCAALMVGFTSAIVSDQRANGLDRDQTQAYAVAHAGLEKLTSDLTALFRSDFSPAAAQINTVAGVANRPSITGFTYTSPGGGSGYSISFIPDPNAGPNQGNPYPEDPLGSNISSGPYQGFKGIITPYTLTVTARGAGGAEVRLRRTLQTVAIPVFQFGMFSETDLAFHAGDDFNFGGRVHSNGNLYLAQADSSTLTLSDRITAVGEIIRTHLPNDLPTTTGYNGTVLVPTVIKTPTTTTLALARNQGSLTGATGVPSNGPTTAFWTTKNSSWDSISTGTYKSNIRNGRTGARRLDLPLVADTDGNGVPDAQPIELIRRPPVNDLNFILQQRYFWLASIRIMLSDDINDIQNLPTVTQGAGNQPVLLDGTVDYTAGFAGAPAAAWKTPLALSAGTGASGTIPANVHRSTAGQPLIGGYIKIELKRNDGTWIDVTKDILSLGISGRNLADISNATLASRLNLAPAAPNCPEMNPNAVIRLQRVRDVPAAAQTTINSALKVGQSCGYTVDGAGVQNGVSLNATDYWPNVLYDPREGQTRDGLTTTDMELGGVMHYVELDMNNLRRYILGQIGTLGNQARNDNGFIVYFSDRRNNNNDAGNETSEYGFEDTVNPALAPGAANNVLDTGEDANGNGVLDVYGATAKSQNVPLGTSLAVCNPALPLRGIAPLDCAATVNTVLTDANMGSATLKQLVLRANKAILFRRALKIVNGGINGAVNSIVAPGLTVASENPVYIQGNFNATAASANVEPNVATSVLGDAVTLLSNNWSDIRSFNAPSASASRAAATTGFRVAIVTGKTRAFPKPGFASASFGSDGGAHNFVRLLEDWDTPSATLRYRGSFVSFFYSRQATGSFKCCSGDTYVRGTRDWTFDDDFLLPALLPPGTPMFRDVNTLTFRQILRPNEQ